MSPFQPFPITPPSTVPTPNIPALPTPILLPPPAPLFSISIIPFIPPPTPFIQPTLPQLYNLHHKQAPFPPAPPYYITKALNQKSLPILFPLLITLTFPFLF
ncbi:alanine:cation symporter family protein, partial [Staphylococcus epidermidis]|uniref:alanine:cation symporter family protein n=1 Tax=Staphylococcus epidermidis TaxID=1282 RepID=UPI0037DA4EF2